MSRFSQLATVSMIALGAGFSTSALADPTVANITIDLTSPTLDLVSEAGSLQAVASSNNVNSGSTITADIQSVLGLNTATIDDTGNTENVDSNSFTATTIGNQAFSELDPGALSGTGPDDNGGLSEVRSGNVAGTTFVAEASAVSHSNTIDLDAGATGNTITLDQNVIATDVTGNEALNYIGIDIDIPGVDAPTDPVVGSDITLGYASDEQGQVSIGSGSVTASASILATTVQLNDALDDGDGDTDETYSRVTGSAITLRVDDDDADDVVDVVDSTLSLADNAITAGFTGNDADTQVNLTAGNTNSLTGSVGAVTYQANQDTGDEVLNAEVTSSVIRAGTAGNPVEDLSGSTLNVDRNEISADAQGNTADTGVTLTGLNVLGPSSTATTQPDTANEVAIVRADIFAVSEQSDSDVDISALVDDASELRVETGAVGVAGAGSTVSVNENAVAATAGGHDADVTVSITEENSVEAGAAARLVQSHNADSGESNLTATIGDDTGGGAQFLMTVDVAQGAATDEITNSTVTVDSNTFNASARGSEGSASLNIQANSIDADGSFSGGGNPSQAGVDTSTFEAFGDADFTVAAEQVSREATTTALSQAAIDADFGTDDPDITASTLSVSENLFRAEALGNLVSGANLSLDATTISATAGIAVGQVLGGRDGDPTTDDPGTLSAITGVDASPFIDATADAGAFEQTSLTVDNNIAQSIGYGNVGFATMTIDGNQVDDNGQAGPVATSSSTAANAQGGFTVALAQEAAELDFDSRVLGSTLVDLSVASTGIADSDISASDNAASAFGFVNQGGTLVDIDANSLDASTIVNTLQVASAVDATVEVTADAAEITVSSEGTADITNTRIMADRNTVSAAVDVNTVDNRIDITAQTLALTDTARSSTTHVDLPVTFEGGATAENAGEIALVNVQFGGGTSDLDANTVQAIIADGAGGVTIDVDAADGAFIGGVASASNNRILADLSINNATNTIDLDVGTIDLTGGTIAPNVGSSGPVATLVSAQETLLTDSYSLLDDPGTVGVNLDGVNGLVSQSTIAVDGNVWRSQAGYQTAVNTLTASSTVFETTVNTVPSTRLYDRSTATDPAIDMRYTSFSLGNRQYATGTGGPQADFSGAGLNALLSAGNVAGVSESSLSLSNNQLLLSGWANNASNTLDLDFTTSNASAGLANWQALAGTLTAAPNGTATLSASVTGPLTASSLLVNGNSVVLDLVGNRAVNTMLVSGNVLTGHQTTLSVTRLPSLTGSPSPQTDQELTNDVFYGLTNFQSGEGATVSASAADLTTVIEATAGVVNDSTIQVNENVLSSQAVLQQATNQLYFNAESDDASAVIGATGDAVNAGILSRQVADGATVLADQSDVTLRLTATDVSDTSAMSGSIDQNQVLAVSSLGSQSSVLSVEAGATILGADGTGGARNDLDPSLSLDRGLLTSDADDVLVADFASLNEQTANGASSTSTIDNAVMTLSASSAVVNDSLSVDNNIMRAQALGFSSTSAVLLDAGATLDATAQAANRQTSFGTSNIATVDTVSLSATILNATAAATTSSSVSVSNNLIQAYAQGQSTTTAVIAEAGSIASTATEAGEATLGTGPLTVDNATFAAANFQTYQGGEVTAEIDAALGPLSVGGPALGTFGDFVDTDLEVNNNIIAASGVVNSASNSISAVADSSIEGSAGLTASVGATLNVANADMVVANRQVIGEGTTGDFTEATASIENLGILVTMAGIPTVNTAALNNSSVEVNDNVVSAFMVGNTATNMVMVEAGAGNEVPSVAVINSQTATGATISASISNVQIGVTGSTGATGSRTSVSGNTVGGTAIGNRSFNSIGANQ